MSQEKVETMADNQPAVTEMHEYKPRNVTEVKNQNPEFDYRLLSKRKIDHEGGDTRGWEIVQGESPEQIGSRNDNLEEMVDDLKFKNVIKPKSVPCQTGSSDTTRSHGDLILARAPKKWVESRKKYYREASTAQVEGYMLRDRQDRSEATEAMLRKTGLSKDQTREVLKVMGGASMGEAMPYPNRPLVMDGRS